MGKVTDEKKQQIEATKKEMLNAEQRPLILELGLKITDRLDAKQDPNPPEYWGLASLLTDEMAEVMLCMGLRKPIRFEELVKKTKKDPKRLQELLDELSVIGMIEYNWENKDRVKQYVLPRFVPGSAEFMVMNTDLAEKHPIVAEFFEHMSRMALEKVSAFVPLGGAGIGMHVIPVEKAIPTEQKSASIEHISYWLNKYKDKYAVGPCSCRTQQRIRGEGSGDIEGDLCIGVGDMADYLVETNKGRYIDIDEVMKILKRAEKNGYVHQITNIDGKNKIFAICNCAHGVCNALRTSQLFNTPNLSRSAYIANVDKDKCVACGKCVEICPVGAAKLGQKLCTTDGFITYPKMQLPDKIEWGPEKWNKNYRNTAKINCYDTGTSPCKTACPAHLAVQGYIKMAAEGRYLEALKLIKDDNPFPAVCGAICNRRCEEACTRGNIDRAIAIDEIKKFIAEKELDEETRFIPICENHEGKFFEQKMAIIGSGPAGMSAAYYLRIKGYPVTIFEKESKPGGMLVNGVPSFRLEKAVINSEIEVLKAMGIEFKCGVEIGKDISIAELRNQGYKAFYLAIGAQGGRMIGIEGEDANGVMTGIQFLHEINTKADKNRLNGTTVVIGGGNVAIDVARSAIRSGSDEVYMVCLEDDESMPAAPDEIAEAKEENITIKNSWGPKKINVENGKVVSIEFKKCLKVFDTNGRFNPQYDETNTMEIKCSNVMLSIGQSIQWGKLLEGEKIELNRNKTVKADKITYQTSVEDIFAGGDVYTGPSFAIDAIAAGKKACESMHRFVHEGHSLTLARDLREFISLDKNNIVIETFDTAKRQIPGHKAGIATATFSDLRASLTQEQILVEANRCLGCGASIVDENKCIGCGLCTTKCNFDAIHLSRDLPKASRMIPAEKKVSKILPYMLARKVKIMLNKNKN